MMTGTFDRFEHMQPLQ